MLLTNSWLRAEASALSGWITPRLAQVQWTSVQDFKNAAGTIAGLLTIVAWVLAIIAWFVGAAQKEQNPSAAKFCFFLVWMFAIGVPVVSLLFYLFVGAEGTPTPNFH